MGYHMCSISYFSWLLPTHFHNPLLYILDGVDFTSNSLDVFILGKFQSRKVMQRQGNSVSISLRRARKQG